MEFLGVEVKAGKPLRVTLKRNDIIHICQAVLDCEGKEWESVCLLLKYGGKEFVIGILSQEEIPQISLDLACGKEFDLYHDLEKGSVYFVGYKAPNIIDLNIMPFSNDDDGDEEEEEEEEDDDAASKYGEEEEDDDVEEEEEEEEEEEVKDNDNQSEDDYEEDKDNDDDEKGIDAGEDEKTPPKKPEPNTLLKACNKKRENESASKTPVSAKKAKPPTAETDYTS